MVGRDEVVGGDSFPGERERACHPRCLPARLRLTTSGDSERLALSLVDKVPYV